MNLDLFFATARERYLIKLKRDRGEPRPWTEDQVFLEHRFCNVFREDDKVTTWFREAVREPMRDDPRVVFAATAFRFFNLVSTAEIMEEVDLFRRWDPEVARVALAGKKPLITGAYMVKTPLRRPKLEGLIEILDPVWAKWRWLAQNHSLESMHSALMEFPWVGPFMAYQAVCDLRYTALLENAPDLNTWTSLGPGSARGLSRLLTGDTDTLKAGNARHNLTAIEAMKEILQASKDASNWPADWPEWELSTVQHWLCEWDKIERTRLLEGTPKQKYNGRG